MQMRITIHHKKYNNCNLEALLLLVIGSPTAACHADLPAAAALVHRGSEMARYPGAMAHLDSDRFSSMIYR